MKTTHFLLACRSLLVAALSATALISNAQLLVTPQTDLQQLAASITGPGVQISNPSITCHALGFGEFSFTGSQLGVDEGVILTTGRITDAPGPNNNNGGSNWFGQGTPGDTLLNIVTGRSTRDACKFEFDIIPVGDSLSFDFVFASEEYNEWVGSQYNDVFGFFISGPGIVGDPGAGNEHNIAIVPGGSQAVTINNVNNGSNSSYYFDNVGGSQIQYDGFTRNLTAKSVVTPCGTYHLKLVVADASDRAYDSGVFIDKVESNNITMAAYTANGTPDMVEGCNPGWVRFTRPFPRPTPLTIQYYIKGTAINGTDYSAIAPISPNSPKSITIPANQTYVDRPVNPLADALNEPTEYLTFILGNPFCPAQNLDTLQFNIADTLIATISPGNVVICQGDSVQYHVTGGQNYVWSPSSSVSDPSSADPWIHPASNTNYTITISEGTCTRTQTRLVRVSKLAISGVVTPPLCNGDANGAINMSHALGFPPYTYSWTGPNGFTSSTEDITGLEPGTYTVVVTDAACSRTQSFNVIAPAVLTTSITPSILPFGQNIACNGGNTGDIATTIGGGTAPYTMAWSGPSSFSSSSANINGLIAGNYVLTVTDANGCVSNANATLTQPLPMTASITSTTAVTCFGDNLGSATAAAIGGIPPYAFAWGTMPAQNTATATSLAAGSYPVTVTDGYGCQASATATVVGPVSALNTSLSSQTNVLCFGNNTGAASISINGGSAPYSTTWNTTPAQNGTSAVNLPAGTWTTTVTDANGCSTTRDVTITQPAAALSANVFTQTNVNCFGTASGSATISVSGGTGPYTYLWNTTPAQNTATANNLGAGNHICTVRDVNNCQTTVGVTITQPAAALSSSIGAQSNVNCFGGSTGSATVNASGGTSPYSFSWNTTPAQNTATANNLVAGTWTCTITDAQGCTNTRNVTITQPTAALSTSLSAQVNVNCFGNSTGSATVAGNGGTAPYTYGWNTVPVQNTAMASNLAAGTWICTVTDSQGCTATRSVTITQPVAALSASTSAQTNVNCFSANTGSATVTANGGTSPYSYSWNTAPAQSTATASNLTAGTWTCIVTDANGCTATQNVTITQPAAALNTSISAQTNVLCYGNATGTATVVANAGTPPYTFSWNTTPTQNTATATGLTAGTWTCTVTDANGCTATRNITITQPATALTSSLATQTNVNCFGNSTGSATVAGNGGTTPYNYSWNTTPAQNTATANNLSAGTWTCTITDANGCTTVRNVTITQPGTTLSASLASQTNVNCFGNGTGSAAVSVSGGTPSYTFNWNTTPPQITAAASNLIAGTWTCSVTDAQGCSTAQNVTITQPAAALSTSISAQANVLCFGNTTGSATVAANGGTAPYAFNWNTTPAQNTSSASNLAAGTYICTVTDALGCSTAHSVTIAQPSAALTITGTVNPATCGGAATGSVNATVTGGSAPYTYSWTGPGSFSASTEDITNLVSGVYALTTTDANGCSTTQSFNVGQPGLFTVSGTTSSFVGGYEVSCATATNGTIAQTISGGTLPYTFTWTGPGSFSASTEDLSALAAGTYTMVLTDGNGCSTSATYTLDAPAVLNASLSAPTVVGGTNINCSGASTGSINATIVGGTTPFGLSWSGPGSFTSTNEDISSLIAGTYVLSITDANGCTANASTTLTQPTALTATASMTTAVSCFGGNNGVASASANGGTAPYSYAWSTAPAQNGTSATGLATGPYTVLVTDANGCTTTSNVSIAQPAAALSVAISAQTNVLIFGQSTGSATASASAGTGPYSYSWNTTPVQNSATAINLAAGSYTVTATDANGCNTSTTVIIGQPANALSASIAAQTNVLCFGNSTGSATAAAGGGTAPYSYSWNTVPVQNTATVTGLTAGTWTCTVTDVNGAITTVQAIIGQPVLALNTSISAQANVDCFGNATGNATVNATGGTPLYTFVWNTTPAQNTAAATGLPAGSYSCTVIDNNGCSSIQNVVIAQPAASLSASIASQTAVSCFGGSNGTASANATGGTAPYTFSWNTTPAQIGSTATGLGAGTWTCTVNDANGCGTNVSVTIAQPASPLSLSIGAAQQATCGIPNGSATAVPSGGTGPYSYSWNTAPLQSAATMTGVSAGSYTVTVTDANSCVADASTTITSPSGLGISVVNTVGQSCFGSSNGQATVSANGGIAPYTFAWNTSPVQTSATAVGLTNGNYTATVTDASGCTAQMNVPVNGPTAALANTITSVTDVLCFSGSTGGATVSASGGTSPYTYSWNTPTPTIGNVLSGVPAGTYTVSVTDANGCNTATNVTITQPALDIFTYVESYQHESCFGANDGWVTVQIGGGSGSFSVEWNTNPVQYGTTATGLGVGFYTATVTDNNGCSVPKYFPVIVNGPSAALSISTVTSDHDGLAISCPGGNDGSIDATVTGGTGPYQYTWTSALGATFNSQDIQSLSAGSYSLTSTDANGCTTSATVVLGEPSPIAITASIITAACQASSTGAIDATISGGTAPFTVAWSGPNGFSSVQQDLTALAAGIYTVVVTDAHGCTTTSYFDVTEPGLINVTGSTSLYNGGVNVSCSGSSDGSIDATIAGGVGPYTLLWNGPAGSTYYTEDIAGLTAGSYSLSVQDANGCAALTQFVLTQPAALTTQLQNTLFNGADLSCSNAGDGVIEATLIGGTPALTYAWSGPNGFSSASEDISGLSEGTYTLQTTDLNGCVSNAAITLNAPMPIDASVASPTFNSGSNVSCDGESDGSITVVLTGGTGIISTVWSGPNGFSSTDLTPNGLEAGTYTATFTDVNGCTSTASITLTAPDPTSLFASTSMFPNGTSVSCATANDGTIDLLVAGGAGNVSYQWTGPNAFTANTEDIIGLIAGTYSISTIDGNGCTATQSYTLTAPAPLLVSETVVPAACFGSNTAAIDLAITGGTSPYDILWSGPGAFSTTTEDLTALYAGVYVANITDANGCDLTYPVTVTQANTFQVTATLSTYPGGFNVSCAGISNGSIELVTSGGTAPYYYQWIGPNGYSAFTEDIQGLEAGTYNLILNDDNGCSTLFTYTLTGADPLATGLVSQVFPGGANTGCTDSQDGEIDALVLGGIQPYQYSWTSDIGYTSNTEDLIGLEPGTYQLLVTDALGCSTTDSITLSAPVPVNGTATATTLTNGANVSCYTSTDGNIDLTISGGAQPYIVEWSGPQGFISYQEDPTGVAAGTYDAVITDLNGCTATSSITLTAPSPVNIDLTASLYGNGANLPCQGSSMGTLIAAVSGGSSNFTYAWNGPNGFTSTSDSLNGIAAGTYTLQVTDGAGCVASDSYTLTQPTDLDLISVVSDAGFGYAVSCTGNDGAISISVNGGTMPYVFDWTGTNGFASLNEDLSGLASGSYQLNLIDANGCASTQNYVLSQPADLVGSTLVSGTVCDSATDGAIDLTVTGGVAPFTFYWTGTNSFASSNEDINALPGGTYDVVITDAMNCSATTTATVLASSSIDLAVYVSDYGNVNIPCFGDSSGVIELTLGGGSGSLDLQWTGPNGFTSTDAQLSGLLAGTYEATITDVNGCSADTTIILTEPAGPLSGSLSAFAYPSGTNISCTGSSDGSIDATVIGGTGPYSFDWRGPDSTVFSTEDINGLQAGTYDLVIVDVNQCTYTASITLNEPDSALSIDATLSSFVGGYGASCSGSSDGSINVTLSGGNGNASYSWTGPNGFTSTELNIDSLASGTYTVTVTDLNGCTLSEPIDITAPATIDADLVPTLFPGGTTISCNGAADGSLTAVISGGTSGYTTQWTGPNGFSSSLSNISGLAAGTYCLSVVDTNGCSVQSCTDLIAPTQLGLSATTLDAICGGGNGSVDLTVNGGTAPFTFAWDNGTINEDLANVPAAAYVVQVTDVNGCIVDTTVVVNGSANLLATGQPTDNACASGSDGTIDLSVLNGTAPYSFAWSNGATSEDLSGLAEDTYTVTVADANGCSWNGSFTISAPLPISVDSSVYEYSNGYNLSAYGSDNGIITLTPSGGTAPYTYAWSNGATTASVNGLAAGTYTVLITDANGCTVLLTFTLDQPTGLAMPTGFSPNGDGANDAYIVQGLDGFASNQLVVFNRWGNVVYERLNYKNEWSGENLQGELLPNGTYFVILRINEGSMTLQNYVDLRR